MAEDEKKEEIKETSMEMFLITDFNIIKKLLSCVSFPSHTFVYQMPDKADKYVDNSVEKSADLMNQLLEYQRSEGWRVSELIHATEFKVHTIKLPNSDEEREVVDMSFVDKKNQQQFKMTLAGLTEAIIVPDLHSVVIVPAEPLLGNIAPNTIIRLVGLVQHKYFKCVLSGEDDKEHEGQRTLTMHYEPLEDNPSN